MSNWSRWTVAATFILAASGCSRPPPPPTGDVAVVELSAAEVRERLDRSLRLRGLAILGGPTRSGPIEAAGTGPVARGWADCPGRTLTDPSRTTSRRARVTAMEVTTSAIITVEEAGAQRTRVGVRTEQIGWYVNPFSNNPVTGRCASTGLLERELLEALRLA